MLNCHSPLNEKFIFGSFLKILFGDQLTRKASSSFKQKRRLSFESLESRELLSASPLSLGVFDDNQSPFEQSTSYYVGENSNTNTGTDNTVESALNETIETMLFQTMGGKMMCCESNLGAVAATVETSSLGETTATGLGTQGIVIVERSDENDCGIASDLTVTYRLSGTATLATDYSVASSLVYHENNGDSYYEGTFVIPANITTYNYIISVLNDSLVESSETITFTLVSAENDCCTEYTVTSSAAFTIQDDDDWTVTISGGGDLEEELNDYDELSYQTITVTRSGGQDESYAIYVTLDTTDTAVFGSDYQLYLVESSTDQRTLLSSNVVTIPAGETSVELEIEVIDDESVERLYESYSIAIASATSYEGAQYQTSGSVSGTIEDNDKLLLTTISFLNNLNLISDTEGSFGTSWQTGTHWNYEYQDETLPVAYSSGGSNNILSCEASIFGLIDPDLYYSIEVQFTWSGGGTSEWISFYDDGTYTAELSETFAELFGQQQAYYEAASTLTWDFKVDGEDRGTFGESVNPIYVTYSDPVAGSTLYHTVVHTGCAAASEIGETEQAVFDAIWEKFQSLSISKINFIDGVIEEGETLTYYGKDCSASTVDAIKVTLPITSVTNTIQSPSQFPSLAREFARQYVSSLTWTTQGLLSKTDGTCGAWQDFCVSVFGAQGIVTDKLGINVNNEIEAFEVKTGTAGQGTDSPRESIWGDHAVIEYNGSIYDPSYGLEYGAKSGALLEFMLTSVESVGCYRPLQSGEDKQGYGFIYESYGFLDYSKVDYYFKWI
jgi:hypothetical protein